MAKKERSTQEKQAADVEAASLGKRVEEEEAQRQAELDRLYFSPGNPIRTVGNSIDDEDADADETALDFVEEDGIQLDLRTDVDVEIIGSIKTKPMEIPSLLDWASLSPSLAAAASDAKAVLDRDAPPRSSITIKNEDDGNPKCKTLWASSMQLTTFRANASRIADDYIKENGLRLSRSKSRYSGVRDYSAYLQGISDGKKIDVCGKRIEAWVGIRKPAWVFQATYAVI